MATKAKPKAHSGKVPRLEVTPQYRRDQVAVPERIRQPGLAYRWAGMAPGADPSDLDARIEELEERGYHVVLDERGGPIRKRGMVLMAMDQREYDRRQAAKVERNRQLNRAQADHARRELRQRLAGQGRVIEAQRQELPPEPLLSEDETFAE